MFSGVGKLNRLTFTSLIFIPHNTLEGSCRILNQNQMLKPCKACYLLTFDSILCRTLLGYYAEGMHAIFYLNTANEGASAKASPFHALIVLEKNDCPYSLQRRRERYIIIYVRKILV